MPIGHTLQHSLKRLLPATIKGKSALAVLLISAAMGLGWQLRPAIHVLDQQLTQQREQIRLQRAELGELRSASQVDIDALAVRMTELHAYATRLNALGERLVEVGQLDPLEFDFTQPPPIGGPAEITTLAMTANPSFEPGASIEAFAVPMSAELELLDQRLLEQGNQLDALASLLRRRALEQQFTPSGWPVSQGYISSTYGYRSDPFNGKRVFHQGLDFASPAGGQVHAVAAGVITWAGWRSGFGQLVEIDHGQGLVTRYAHNKSTLVAPGQRVEAGDPIGLVGASGRATAPHVHLEVVKDGIRVNPYRYIQSLQDA